MAGGRVGKDGIHGATFSSEALTESSPVSAVQIGDPLTQKRMTDFLLEARDRGLLTGLTDNGAGGLSSSVGEMAQMTNGATLHLERVPLKYTGLMPYEIVVSESQERMTFSTRQFEALEKLAQHHGVEVSAIGEFHDRGVFEIQYQDKTIASLDLDFLHDGVPQMQLEAIWEPDRAPIIRSNAPDNPDEILLKLLSSPNICSREALIRQYDHEVQGRSVVKPLMGTLQTGPCDAAVQQVVLGEQAGIVVSNGLCPQFSDWDPYHMAMLAVDEAVRNAVAVGADPKTIALLDNFCWPDPIQSKKNLDGYHKLAQLVRSCVGLKEIALAYRTPLISGKDSMKNDFDDGKFRLSIPPTLLISAIGKIPDISKAVTMEFKAPGDRVFLLGDTSMHFGGSQYYLEVGWSSPYCPQVNIILARRTYQLLHEAMMKGWIRSCHDCSEGGMAVALAESTLASPYGVEISLTEMAPHSPELRWDELLFSESPSRFILSVAPEHEQAVREAFKSTPLLYLGQVTEEPRYKIAPTKFMPPIDLASETLRLEWQKPPAACYDIREGFPHESTGFNRRRH